MTMIVPEITAVDGTVNGAPTAFVVNPLSSILAAEVLGLDLSKPLDGPTKAAVNQAFLLHQVLVFRGQALSTGRRALFLGAHASHLEGLPFEEGRARVEALEAHAIQQANVYQYQWASGDVLMWDNRCLLHRALPNVDVAEHPRVLHRTCLRGTATN